MGRGCGRFVPLANLNEDDLPVLLEAAYQHWKTVPEHLASEIANATEILMGLRYSEELIKLVFRRLETMEESVIYQRNLKRGEERGKKIGREEGRSEGRLEQLHHSIIRILKKRFIELPTTLEIQIEAILEIDRLERIIEAAIDVSRPEDVLRIL